MDKKRIIALILLAGSLFISLFLAPIMDLTETPLLFTILSLTISVVLVYFIFKKPIVAGWFLIIYSCGGIISQLSVGLIALMVPTAFGLMLTSSILLLIAGIMLLKIKSKDLPNVQKKNKWIEPGKISVSLIFGVLLIIISQGLVYGKSYWSAMGGSNFFQYKSQLGIMLAIVVFLGLAQVISFAIRIKYKNILIWGIFVLLIASLIYPIWLATIFPYIKSFIFVGIVGAALLIGNILFLHRDENLERQ